MAYNPTTDFIALWRNIAGQVSKETMPGLDYVVAALARAGIITLSVSATPPVTMQSITAWLQTAVPSYSTEGSLHLWNPVTDEYEAATPALFLTMLEATAGQSGVSWWTSTGGPPLNTVGNNGDFDFRLDSPYGAYGPKAAGVWPADPIPGTADVITSTSLDNAFGTAEGLMLFRGPDVWQSLAIAPQGDFIQSNGADPVWNTLTALMDFVFGAAQGDILYRGAATWEALPPSTAGFVLSTGGPAANPAWEVRTAEFPSGTVMLFQQSAAPPGWTKQTSINDYGLRVVSGSVGSVSGTPFSTVFAQTAVGNTTLALTQIAAHIHDVVDLEQIVTGSPGAGVGGGGGFGPFQNPSTAFGIDSKGGSGAHTHSVNLALSYVDVIIASKN